LARTWRTGDFFILIAPCTNSLTYLLTYLLAYCKSITEDPRLFKNRQNAASKWVHL